MAFLTPLSSMAADNTLSLDDFLREALENNPGVQRILADTGIAEGQALASRGIDDFRLGGQLGTSHTEPDPLLGFEANESDGRQLGLSLDRTFSATGTRFNLAYDNLYTDRTPPLTTYGSSYYQPSLSLQLVQPLLKNAGGIQDRLNVDLADIGLALARLQAQEGLESYLAGLTDLYLDWYLAVTQADLYGEVYRQAQEQERVVALKVRRQVAESYELLRMQEAREGYYSRWQETIGQAAGLGRQVWQQRNAGNGYQPLQPANPATATLVKASPTGQAIDYLRTESRLKQILDQALERELRIKAARANAQRPDVSLSLGYRRHGIDEDSGDAHGEAFERDDYSVSLQYRHPLGNREASGQYASQLASEQRARADMQQRLLDAEAALRDLLENERAVQAAAEAADRQVQLGARKLREEERLYKIGRLDLFQLLVDQTSQLERRLAQQALEMRLLKIRVRIAELLDRIDNRLMVAGEAGA